MSATHTEASGDSLDEILEQLHEHGKRCFCEDEELGLTRAEVKHKLHSLMVRERLDELKRAKRNNMIAGPLMYKIDRRIAALEAQLDQEADETDPITKTQSYLSNCHNAPAVFCEGAAWDVPPESLKRGSTYFFGCTECKEACYVHYGN